AYRIKVQIQKFYDAMWIKISHNGLGLSSKEQQEIFEPFFNNDHENSDDAGKRLSFSHFIITEHHQGQMAVTSDVEVGSTFHMQLQLK
ncbi:MAG: ATP-binding protein, partial [Pseudomonadales bacterium]|nr:ATP-binding protein [Pseudomonadales bacterium]